ncbi:AAA family ATPase [Candidatus Pacearchaeota archaeon]|nr:AAA family ATPase [Candidatus Pacearchaeota archaeon]
MPSKKIINTKNIYTLKFIELVVILRETEWSEKNKKNIKMQTNIFVISGGPGVGKTTIVNELGKLKYNIIPEAARVVAESDKRFIGKSIKEINRQIFQDEVLKHQIKLQDDFLLKNNDIGFSDRGFGDSLAYYKINRLKFPKKHFDYVRSFRYKGIFILEPLRFYKTDGLRVETKKEQQEIHDEISRAYENLGYYLIKIPQMPIEERIAFILKNIENL